MSPIPSYARNQELFTDFYRLQGRFTGCLADRPAVVRQWLEALPPREPEAEEKGPPRAWRTARLSTARRRELARLLERVEDAAEGPEPLAGWLLAAVPVATYFEIADAGAPLLRSDPGAEDCRRRLLTLRETLFHANYGLAKAAAKRRQRRDYPEMLSAASSGLLDAIDRYVPGDRSARFAHFAGYWIRYHLTRHFQKSASLVSFPVNQHRIRRRLDRYLGAHAAEAPPSTEALCSDLGVGPAALRAQRDRPTMLSLHAAAGQDAEGPAWEECLWDPTPAPHAALEEAEVGDRLRLLLRRSVTPGARVMLAYLLGLGGLGAAAEDYLTALERQAVRRLREGGRLGPMR